MRPISAPPKPSETALDWPSAPAGPSLAAPMRTDLNWKEMDIHPTALVDRTAKIGIGTRIGPFACIEANVRLGRDNVISGHAIIRGDTVLGDRNRVGAFCVIGADPQSDRWSGGDGRLVVGDDNWLREYVTVSGGLTNETQIGSRNMLMAYAHVGHDCVLGDDIHLANGATLGGHVQVQSSAWLGGLCAIHQSTRLGRLCFVAGGAMVTQDVAPFCLVQGDRASLIALNSVGLKRQGYSSQTISQLRRAFRHIFCGGGSLQDRLKSAPSRFANDTLVLEMVTFLCDGERSSLVALRRAA